jgi:para-nitrobenzyl esterase
VAWTRNNAAAFGGDPASVTLFGESAGGVSTCLHLLAPGSRGFFQRAIIESGPCGLTVGTEEAAETQGDAFAAALGCHDPATVLSCMRARKADDLLVALPLKMELGAAGAVWAPFVDGQDLPERPDRLLAAGSFAKVPTIVGSNKDEGTIFFAFGLRVNGDADYLSLMDHDFAGQGAKIVARYPSASFGSARAAAAEALGDGFFVCPTRRVARALAKGGAPVYRYRFVHPVNTPVFMGLGAFHSAEVPFIFGNPYFGFTLGAREEQLSRTMIGYWSRLARSGDPNGGEAPAWPRYDEVREQSLVLDLTVSTAAARKGDPCDFWDGL